MIAGIPKKDLTTAGFIIAELKKREKIDWKYFLGIEQIENSIRKALEAKAGQKLTHWRDVDVLTAFIFGAIYHKELKDVDWGDLEAKIIEYMWMRDGSSF